MHDNFAHCMKSLIKQYCAQIEDSQLLLTKRPYKVILKLDRIQFDS